MKRYLIFAVVGPLLGGFWLLLTTTLISGYFSFPPNAAEIAKLLAVFVTTLQYSYLFGVLPMLMIGAVEDILFHVKRIGPWVRISMVGVIAFGAAELLYGSRGPDSGAFQFVMYGLVGFIPGAVSAWLVYRFVEQPEAKAAETQRDGGQQQPAA